VAQRPVPVAYGPGNPWGRPPKPSPLPQTEVAYHQTLRTPTNHWWKGLAAIAVFVLGYVIITLVLQGGAIAVDAATGRVDPARLAEGQISMTPTLLLAVNLTNALCIPLSGLLIWAFWGQPVRFMHSVRGWVRWRLMARAALVIGPIWVVYIVVLTLLGPPADRGRLTAESVVLLVIVLLTTPFQSAGEEYGARGLIARAAGSWAIDPRVSFGIATLVSSVVFMLAHGAGDPWLIAYYFLFGVGLSVVVWRTGGLEVAVVIHAVNNLCAFGVTILMGQNLDQSLDRSAGSAGPFMLVPMLMMAAVVALVWWLAGREGISRTFRPPSSPAPASASPTLPTQPTAQLR
jgi:CAAX protease family protein